MHAETTQTERREEKTKKVRVCRCPVAFDTQTHGVNNTHYTALAYHTHALLSTRSARSCLIWFLVSGELKSTIVRITRIVLLFIPETVCFALRFCRLRTELKLSTETIVSNRLKRFCRLSTTTRYMPWVFSVRSSNTRIASKRISSAITSAHLRVSSSWSPATIN